MGDYCLESCAPAQVVNINQAINDFFIDKNILSSFCSIKFINSTNSNTIKFTIIII